MIGTQVVLDVDHIECVDRLFAGFGGHREALGSGEWC